MPDTPSHPAGQAPLAYRPEIDGLRAVAVLLVIIYHADFGIFPGGFIGVDVFFVISGFLISTILLSDLDNGSFSPAAFYERRCRRWRCSVLPCSPPAGSSSCLLISENSGARW